VKSHKRGVRDVKISHFNLIDLIDQDVVKIGHQNQSYNNKILAGKGGRE
jgi:hypothetical protein